MRRPWTRYWYCPRLHIRAFFSVYHWGLGVTIDGWKVIAWLGPLEIDYSWRSFHIPTEGRGYVADSEATK